MTPASTSSVTPLGTLSDPTKKASWPLPRASSTACPGVQAFIADWMRVVSSWVSLDSVPTAVPEARWAVRVAQTGGMTGS